MRVAIVALALLLSGCAARNGGIEIQDRVVAIVQSDMSDDAKVQAIQAIVEREQDRGTNLVEILKDTAIAGIIAGLLR